MIDCDRRDYSTIDRDHDRDRAQPYFLRSSKGALTMMMSVFCSSVVICKSSVGAYGLNPLGLNTVSGSIFCLSQNTSLTHVSV